MAVQYIVKPESRPHTYTVSKWEGKPQPSAVYTVQPGFRGFLECDCPAKTTCKHIKLVVRYIRGDRRMFYELTPVFKPKPDAIVSQNKPQVIKPKPLSKVKKV